jgi:hypothetical protein
VLWRKLSVLLGTALLVVMMFAVAGPALAEGCAPNRTHRWKLVAITRGHLRRVMASP